MPLTFPRDVFMESYLPGQGWVDVTAQVRQTSPVTITRGRGNEQGKVAPSKLTAVMDNDSGNWSLSNPMGDYYGLLSRNTPVRWGFTVARDAFGRTVGSGWGTADLGGAWSTFGTGSSAVGSGKGTHSISLSGNHYDTYLSTERYKDVQVSATFSLPFTNVTGGYVEAAVILRGQSTSTYYLALARITTSETVQVYALHYDGFAYTTIAPLVTVPGLTHTSSQALRLVGLIEGSTIRVKVHPAADDEPYAWHTSGTDTLNRISGLGWVGVESFVETGNTNTKPIVVSYDDLDVRLIRFTGELADLKPRWDESHAIKTAELEAAGIMRRLARSSSARSAPRVYIPTTAAVHYWPLEGQSLSTAGLPAVGDHPMVLASNLGPAVHFGKGDLGSILNPGVALLGDNDRLTATVSMPTFVDEWTVDHVRAGGADSSSRLEVTTSAGVWQVNFLGASKSVEIVRPVDGSVGVTSYPKLFDGSPHHVRFAAIQSGSVVNVFLNVDTEVASGGSGLTAHTLTPATSVSIVDLGAALHSDPLAVAHVAVYAEGRPLTDFHKPVLGWVGETAGRRAQRLCAENGILFDYVGNLDQTAPMGPQRPLPVLTLLQECADAEQGTLYEPRSVIGVALRTLRGTCAQQPAVTLTYSSGHIAPPLNPSGDDLPTGNDVTAKRVEGGEYRATQETGPLNVHDPGTDPDAVGRYDQQVTVNVATDQQLPDTAAWLRHVGTIPEDRYPKIKADLAASALIANQDLSAAVLATNIDDRLLITNLTAADIYQPIDQIARGCTEIVDTEQFHEITVNTAPYEPYRILVWGDSSSRWDSDGSTLGGAGIDDNDLTAQVAFTTLRWTTDAAQFPFTIDIDGEVITVSGISGTTSPQTFTFSTRSVNGVVKSHPAGTPVLLADPVYLGRV